MRILGIDPGINLCGYGILEVNPVSDQVVVIEAGVIRVPRSSCIEKRLLNLHRDLEEIFKTLQPDCVGLEQLYSHTQRVQTAIIMGHARGVICLAAAQNDVPIHHFAATSIKKTLTGNGRAPKGQVQLSVARHLGLTEIPDPPDIADALAIALCHYYLNLRNQM